MFKVLSNEEKKEEEKFHSLVVPKRLYNTYHIIVSNRRFVFRIYFSVFFFSSSSYIFNMHALT